MVAAPSKGIKPWRAKGLKSLPRIVEKRMAERNKEQNLVFKGHNNTGVLCPSKVPHILIQDHSRGWKWKNCSICSECFGFAFKSKIAKALHACYLLFFFPVFMLAELDKLYHFSWTGYLENVCSCVFYIQYIDINIFSMDFSWICE